MGFEVILPFLRPIEHLINDAEISEIMVNGSTRVFIERLGIVEEVPGVTIPEKSLRSPFATSPVHSAMKSAKKNRCSIRGSRTGQESRQ